MSYNEPIDMKALQARLGKRFSGFSFGTLALIVLALFVLSKAVLVVEAGQRVVVFNSFTGVEHRVLDEGMHLLMPLVQSAITYDVRTHSYTMAERTDEGQLQGDDAIECLTSDGQKIKLDISIIHHLLPSKVWMLHQQVGPDYLDKIIRPTARSIARNTIANYTVTELYSGDRTKIQNELTTKIGKSLAPYYIAAPESLIRNVIFSPEFSNAIEMKQVAQQDSERMRYVLEKEKREKERKIIEAQGEAEAIREKANALKSNPQLIQYEYVSKLAPGVKAIITNQSSIMNFPADLLDKK
jgi:prohibitin 2